MYSIEKQTWGFKLTFAQSISNEEMEQWLKESQHALSGITGDFGILVDMRGLESGPSDIHAALMEGLPLYKKSGKVRSVVILNTVALTLQLRRLAKDSGIYETERYINASLTTDWEQSGVEWLTRGVDPDLGIGPSK